MWRLAFIMWGSLSSSLVSEVGEAEVVRTGFAIVIPTAWEEGIVCKVSRGLPNSHLSRSGLSPPEKQTGDPEWGSR